jgi:hypothetical protein
MRFGCGFVCAWIGLWSTAPAHGAGLLRITEWQHGGDALIELTNAGDAALDLSHWSTGDETELPRQLPLTPPGSSGMHARALTTERSADAFRASWDLAANLAILGDDSQIYDAATHLVDSLTYNEAAAEDPGTLNVSGTIPQADLPGFAAQQFDHTLPEPGVSVAIGLALAALGLFRRGA